MLVDSTPGGTPLSFWMAGLATQGFAAELVFAARKDQTAIGTGLIGFHVFNTLSYILTTELGFGPDPDSGDVYNFKRLGGDRRIAYPLLIGHALYSAVRWYRGHRDRPTIYPTFSRDSFGVVYEF